MSEQENEISVLCADGQRRKEWKKPVVVGLNEAKGKGAEGKDTTSLTEWSHGTPPHRHGPS